MTLLPTPMASSCDLACKSPSMFTRIRNGQLRKLTKVEMPSSNFRLKVLEVLKNEGFISSYHIEKKEHYQTMYRHEPSNHICVIFN